MTNKQNKQNKKRKTRNTRYEGFDLIEGTSGIILNGLFIKKDKSELIISTAWKGDFHFRPINT